MKSPTHTLRLMLSLCAALPAIGLAQVTITDPPPEHHFGKIPLQANYAAQYFSVWNPTEQAVTLGQARVDGELATCSALGCAVVAPADFVIGGSDGCSGRTLAPNSGCSILIGFVPQQPGSRVAKLAFPVAGGADVNRMLSGTGVAQPFDCVMDWAERVLPADLVAQPTSTLVAGPYYARCYQGGALCVGADVAVPTFAPASVYVYQSGRLAPFATLASLAALATYPLPSTRRCDQPADGQ
jgi:hypothetical protein